MAGTGVRDDAMSLITELRRRNVIRMAGLYLVGAWLLTQVAGTILPMFGAPEWIARSVVLVLAIGFVPALVVAWVFELTPDGLKRDDDVVPGESIAPQTARRMDRAIIAVLAIALVYFGVDKFVLAPRRAVAQTAAVGVDATAGTSTASLKSIAVLPFENLSDDKANAYFATGMQDEILTRLAGIHDLKVISRTSTEQYASHPPNLRVVAGQLGVATVLEGSVQKADGKVRINLQLIDARSDSHLWAENYDRDLKDVFAVQSDVAARVADALKAQLLPAESERIASVPTRNVQAHDFYLQALALFRQLQTSSAHDPAAIGTQATHLYRQAIAADPAFALAHAQLSYLQSYLHWYNVDSRPDVVALADSAARQALALQPALPEAHLALGYVHYWGHRDYPAALAEFEVARAGMPNNAEVIAAIAYVHRRQGAAERSVRELRDAEVLDPRDSLIPREIANSFTTMHRYADADAAFARSLAIFPGDIEAQEQRATTRMFAGDLAAARRMADAIPADADPQGSVSLLRLRLAMVARDPDAALAALARAPQWLMTRWEHSVAPLDLLRGQALALKGDAAGAHAAFLRARTTLQDSLGNPGSAIDALSYLGLANAGLGNTNEALKDARAAATQMPMSRDPIVGAFQLERLARVEAQVGDAGAAIVHLRQLLLSTGGQTVSVATLKIDPAWDRLRDDPRFQALLRIPPGAGSGSGLAASHG
jgi:TolB-like protein/Tfp pilus assembly protein PilF